MTDELETLLEQMKIALEASQSAQSIASLNGRSTAVRQVAFETFVNINRG